MNCAVRYTDEYRLNRIKELVNKCDNTDQIMVLRRRLNNIAFNEMLAFDIAARNRLATIMQFNLFDNIRRLDNGN